MSFHTTPSASFYIDNNCLIFKEVITCIVFLLCQNIWNPVLHFCHFTKLNLWKEKPNFRLNISWI